MKWIKLDCDYSDDPKIERLCEALGFDVAMAFWPLLLSIVGRYGSEKCCLNVASDADWTWNLLAKRFHCRTSVLIERLKVAAQLKLISEAALNQNVIEIPNMMTRLDEYTKKRLRKSGEPPDNVRTSSGQSPENIRVDKIRTDKNREEEKRIHTDDALALRARLDNGFQKLWDKYPAKDGRKEAEKHFNATVKTDATLTEITTALENYLGHLARNDWRRAKSGKTWFNNWRDWVNWVEPQVLSGLNGGGNGTVRNSGNSGGHPEEVPGSTSTRRTSRGDPIYIPKQQ